MNEQQFWTFIGVILFVFGGPLLIWVLNYIANRGKEKPVAPNLIDLVNSLDARLKVSEDERAKDRQRIEMLEKRPAVYVGLTVHPETLEARIMEVYPLKEE